MSRAGRRRKYSVGEIDRMRRATWAILNAQWGKGQWQTDCEDRLRTYMLNGTSPQEIERAAEEVKHATSGPTRFKVGEWREVFVRQEADDVDPLVELAEIITKAQHPADPPINLDAVQRVFDDLGFDKFREDPEVFDSAAWTGRR